MSIAEAITDELLAEASMAAGVDEEVMATALDMALAGGPDQVANGWWQDAPCRGIDVSLFYPKRGSTSGALLKACASCPVQGECLAAALATGERQGLWGGTSALARKRLRDVLRSAGLMGVVGEQAYIAWQDDGADVEPIAPMARGRKTPEPWAHQLAAVDAIVGEISAGGVCQVALATASGKTLVGAWAAERLGVDQVLVMVPNLALVVQTAEVWAGVEHWAGARTLAVCSDTGDVDLEATTDPFRVLEFLDEPGPAVVYATYQSSPVLVEAAGKFDLIVADEAHHLAGEADKAFGAVLRGEIPAHRTLYMTATPRRFSKRRREVELVGMDDEASGFGRRVSEFRLEDAVAAGVIADYRVVVAAVEREVFDRVSAYPGLDDVDPHLLAGAIAVVRAMGEFGLSSCVSFHTRVDRATSFARLVGVVAEALPAQRPPGPGWAGFVHGATNVRIRRRLLARLADHRTWGILANARALGEGVDLPELDAVAIVDPKNSEVDVLQAAGRALRRPAGEAKVGTILLPVLLNGAGDPDDPFAGMDKRSIELVGGVLRALRAHDDSLGTRLDAARRSTTRKRSIDPSLGFLRQRTAARALLRSRVDLWVPGGATGELAGSLALHLVRESTSAWEEHYAQLLDYVDEEGAIPALPVKVEDLDGESFGLGPWVNAQRRNYKRGFLSAERIAALEAVPGWWWNPREEGWWAKFDALKDYVEIHGSFPPFNGGKLFHQGVNVGSFLATCRASQTSHDNNWIAQFPDRIAALEALPGWVWNTKDATWEQSFDRVRRFVADHGRMPGASDTLEGQNLGRWITKQRSRIKGGIYEDSRWGSRSEVVLSDERIARLRALPGWVEDFREIGDAVWRLRIDQLREWMAANGDQPPPQGVRAPDGSGLGSWANKVRQLYRERGVKTGRGQDRLTDEYVALIESIPGWTWEPHREKWGAAFAALQSYADTHGHASPVGEETWAGQRVGQWVSLQRAAHRRGELEAHRVKQLEALPLWFWDIGAGGRRSIDREIRRRGGGCVIAASEAPEKNESPGLSTIGPQSGVVTVAS
jgi:superfamily II DNA or RNA helicase